MKKTNTLSSLRIKLKTVKFIWNEILKVSTIKVYVKVDKKIITKHIKTIEVDKLGIW